MKKMIKRLLLAGIILTISTSGAVYAAEYVGPIVIASKTTSVSPSQIRWEYRDGKWYGYDQNGNLGHGWMQDGSKYYYFDSTGACLINQMTPDGYYVDTNGAWHQRSTKIFDQIFNASEKFPSASAAWTGEKALKGMQKEVDELFETRRIRITDTTVEYLSGTSKEVELFSISKNASNGSFQINLRTSLDKTSTRKDLAATYDYMIFRAMLHQITSTPDLLEDAVYSSWEEDNRWNISRTEYITVGDALVKYTAGNGYGCYSVYPASK